MDVTTGLATALAGLPDDQLANLGRSLGDAELASMLRMALGQDEPKRRARAARRPKPRPRRASAKRPAKKQAGRRRASTDDATALIMAELKASGKTGRTGPELAKRTKLADWSRRKALQQLEADGRIVREGATFGTRWRVA